MNQKATLDALALAHLNDQARLAERLAKSMQDKFEKIMDFSSFASYHRTRQLYLDAILPELTEALERGINFAGTYLLDAKGAAGLAQTLPAVTRAEVAAEVARAVPLDLFVEADRMLKRGKRLEDVARYLRATNQRACVSAALKPGREYLARAAHRDRDVKRWARVSKSGTPCAFCAMLISRGPVYTVSSFRTHKGCKCSMRLVMRNEPDDAGWTEQARELQDLWDDIAKNHPGEWRSKIDSMRPSPPKKKKKKTSGT